MHLNMLRKYQPRQYQRAAFCVLRLPYSNGVSSNVPNSSGTTNMEENMSTTINALPEEPTACCMSACANCVWLEYAEKIGEYYRDGGESAVEAIKKNVHDPTMRAFLLTEWKLRRNERASARAPSLGWQT